MAAAVARRAVEPRAGTASGNVAAKDEKRLGASKALKPKRAGVAKSDWYPKKSKLSLAEIRVLVELEAEGWAAEDDDAENEAERIARERYNRATLVSMKMQAPKSLTSKGPTAFFGIQSRALDAVGDVDEDFRGEKRSVIQAESISDEVEPKAKRLKRVERTRGIAGLNRAFRASHIETKFDKEDGEISAALGGLGL